MDDESVVAPAHDALAAAAAAEPADDARASSFAARRDAVDRALDARPEPTALQQNNILKPAPVAARLVRARPRAGGRAARG